VGDICEASGITKPTLYHYFGSKRGLLDAIVAERGGPLLAAVRQSAVYDHDVRKGLERIAFAFTRFAAAALDHGNMKGRRRAFAASFIITIDS
jgi:TetR/AcrR family transcriptional regulator